MGKLSEAIAVLDKQGVLQAVEEGIAANLDPLLMIDEARFGLEVVGEKFDRGEYFLMELMRAAQIFQSAAGLLAPKIEEFHGKVQAKGKVLLGTVAGDIHDLGKNIVKILLECRGIEVIDLGVDVRTQKFVKAVEEYQPDVIGLSALLTASVAEMNKVVEALEQAGLRKAVKVIVGGGIVGEIQRSALKADHATIDANEGVRTIEGWIDERAIQVA